MKKAAVTSMRSARGSVGYFHWEDAMTVKVDFSIFFRYMSAKGAEVQSKDQKLAGRGRNRKI